ncbi:MAG: hypothetical protein K8R87_00230 [Verrucomicrobia bacterium]|nr:hypothetical protein [Verrucomicrobiota bacterium]
MAVYLRSSPSRRLTVNLNLAATSQNQALNALLFLYREVLKVELEGIDAKRARHHKRLPVVLTTEEVSELLKGVKDEAGMVCKLLYGCGLRVAEALRCVSKTWISGILPAVSHAERGFDSSALPAPFEHVAVCKAA